MTRPLLVLVTLLVCALPTVASADDVSGAKHFFETGSKHFDLGEFDEALRDFKEGYRLKEDPVFLFNIAQCQKALQLRPDAIRSYKTYLRRRPGAPNRADVELKIAALERDEAEAAARPKNEPKPEAPIAKPDPMPVAVVVASRPQPTPVYKKWWVWTIVGGVVAVGVGVGLGVGLTRNHGSVGNSFPGVQF